MANPTEFTITDLDLNSAASLPTAQSVDTNGTVPINAEGDISRLIIEVVNDDDAALTLKVLAGDTPPALAAGDDLSVPLAASGGGATAKRMIGPFEGAKYIQDDGSLSLNFTAATGAPAASVRVYRLPKN